VFISNGKLAFVIQELNSCQRLKCSIVQLHFTPIQAILVKLFASNNCKMGSIDKNVVSKPDNSKTHDPIIFSSFFQGFWYFIIKVNIADWKIQ